MISPIDKMKLIYIPAGQVRLGAYIKIQRPGKRAYARPTVQIHAFWISQTQVTNAMYARCVKAGACRKAIRKAINPHYYDPKYANHPVVYVTWSDAGRYCKFTGGRLPTEAEWEKAARGNGNHVYPWGDRTRISRLANVANRHTTTVPVGSYPYGASPYGVLDMGGNVREWVQDWFAPSYTLQPPYDNPLGPASGKLRVLKGASWHDSEKSSIIEARFAHLPESAGNNRGFRCAYSR
jgi:formylglycine-generating enzyme required for sulfatase activity